MTDTDRRNGYRGKHGPSSEMTDRERFWWIVAVSLFAAVLLYCAAWALEAVA